MKTAVSFNGTIASTGTTQVLDSNAPQQLPSQPKAIMKGTPPPITITALSANTATIYISSSIGTASGHGYPLQAGKSVTFRTQTTGGIYVNGTSGDKYGVASGISVLHKGGGGTVIPTAIHFWPMNEGSGTTYTDHIGSTNLTLSGAVTWGVQAGMGASPVVTFNGSSTYAQAASLDSSLNFNGTQPMTIAFWIKSGGISGSMTYVGDLVAGTTYSGYEVTNIASGSYGLIVVGNNVGTNQMTAATANGALTSNNPTLIVITYTGSLNLAGVKAYSNGAPNGVTDSSGTLTSGATSTVPFLIGRRSNSTNYYSGYMAYMRVWNVVLTQAQITALNALGPQ